MTRVRNTQVTQAALMAPISIRHSWAAASAASVAIPKFAWFRNGGLGANFGIKATLEEIDSSVLIEFEVREAADPIGMANFKFGTLEQGWGAARAYQRAGCRC
jgi:hypothetical protein